MAAKTPETKVQPDAVAARLPGAATLNPQSAPGTSFAFDRSLALDQPTNLLALQRTTGNQAVQRILDRKRSGGNPGPLQRYVKGEDYKAPGARLSDAANLMVAAPREIYATDAKINEGNQVLTQKGGIQLVKGGQKTHPMVTMYAKEKNLEVAPHFAVTPMKMESKEVAQAQKPETAFDRRRRELAEAEQNSLINKISRLFGSSPKVKVAEKDVLELCKEFSPTPQDTAEQIQAKDAKYVQFVQEQVKALDELVKAVDGWLAFLIQKLGKQQVADFQKSLSPADTQFVLSKLQDWMQAQPTAARFISNARLWLTADGNDPKPSLSDLNSFRSEITATSAHLLKSETAEAVSGNLVLPSDCNAVAILITGGKTTKDKANPAIGETHFIEFQGGMGWANHWGSVVMKDGSDTVTLENAASEKKAPLDRTSWYFGMYGAANSDQSFGTEYQQKHEARSQGMEAQHQDMLKNRKQ